MNTTFSEYRPSAELLPFVQTYWLGHFNLSSEPNYAQSVVPNACIELIIHLTDAHCSLTVSGKNWSRSPDYTLLGLYPMTYEVQFATEVRVFGIRFYPDGFRQLFGVPPAAFLASYEDGVDVLGRSVRDLCSRIREAEDTGARTQLADAFLRSRLAVYDEPCDYTHIAMKLIRRSGGLADYQTLTAQVPISDRQLQREFKNLYGITVNDYMRLSRMNAIQNYMRSGASNLTQLSYDLEFSDQSHFIREFKHFIGLPPGKFKKERARFIVNPALTS